MAVAKYTVRIAKKSRRSFNTRSGFEAFILELVYNVGIDASEVSVVNNLTGETFDVLVGVNE